MHGTCTWLTYLDSVKDRVEKIYLCQLIVLSLISGGCLDSPTSYLPVKYPVVFEFQLSCVNCVVVEVLTLYLMVFIQANHRPSYERFN